MYILSQVIGTIAVTTLIIGFQQKTRKGIILFNALSTILYTIGYVMLRAYDGAAVQILTAVVTIVAHNRFKGFVANHTFKVAFVLELTVVLAGILSYQNIFSICLILGALAQTGSFWLTSERLIRQISFWCSPFWIVYNIATRAYGPACGSTFIMISIGVAIFRYDIIHLLKREKSQ